MIDNLKKPKLIVLTPVKNEDRILDLFLSCTSLWADHIIIADQNSTDRTPEICKKYEKVIYIKNNADFHTSNVRKLLLDTARTLDGNNILFSLDADELLSANFIQMKDKIISQLTLGSSVLLQRINLRGDIGHYRDDRSERSNSWKHFAFYDDRVIDYTDLGVINDHTTRVPKKSLSHTISFDLIKVLHMQFLEPERMLAKQRKYRIDELILGSRSLTNSIKINLKYYPTKLNFNVFLKKIPQKWWADYNLDYTYLTGLFLKKTFYWYDEYSLQCLEKYGTKTFRYLDIRDVDWNIKKNILGSYKGNYSDPRNFFTKLYHKMQFILYFMNKFVPSFLKKYF